MVALCAMIGVFVGSGAFTFRQARGLSYLSNDPTACVNCHIMRDQFDAWQKSSHHALATCNDCHTPVDFLGKYYTKAEHGARHSWGFTFQDFHEPIRMKESSKQVVLENCRRCHAAFLGDVIAHANLTNEAIDCIQCHASVGHGANR
jgi:cytochrome c nitrite reductase small subunit